MGKDGQDFDQSFEINGSAIAEERAIEQQVIPFMGDDLAAALGTGGNIYLTLPGMCSALGLNVRGQLQRIQRTRTLSQGLRRISLQTRGGFQPINCLRIDLIALWLAGIQTKSIKSEFRDKIEAYQEELAPVATQVFMRVLGIRTAQVIPTPDPQIIALADQLDSLTEITTLLREHMEALLTAQGQTSMQLEQAVQMLEALTNRQETTEKQVAKIDERTQRLTPEHGRAVQEAVEHVARAIVRKTPSVSLDQAHKMVYGRLKTSFHARSYIEIPDDRFEEVMTYLRSFWRRITSGEMPEQGSLF